MNYVHPSDVLIPVGTYFVCDNSEAQNMVSTEDVRIKFAKNAQVDAAFYLGDSSA